MQFTLSYPARNLLLKSFLALIYGRTSVERSKEKGIKYVREPKSVSEQRSQLSDKPMVVLTFL